jgi:hypothetical protein
MHASIRSTSADTSTDSNRTYLNMSRVPNIAEMYTSDACATFDNPLNCLCQWEGHQRVRIVSERSKAEIWPRV